MTEIIADKWYDVKECLPEPVNGSELDALLEMVNSDGWKVFKRMKNIEARSSACTALNPSSPLEQCEAGRALWYAQCLDVAFDATLKEAVRGIEPVEKDELDMMGDAIVNIPIPSKAEYDSKLKVISNNADKQ